MNNFDIENRERLVRVEEGITHLTGLLEKIPVICSDVESLKTTQKWIRWGVKTTVGACIVTALGFYLKAIIYLGIV